MPSSFSGFDSEGILTRRFLKLKAIWFLSNNLIRFLVNSTEDDMETKGDFALLLYLKGKRFNLISRVYFKCSTSCSL